MDSKGRRFETAVPIGAGATAEVFERFDRDLGRLVAVKYLRSKNPEIIERLLREARAQAKLRHPGICRIYDIQIEADPPHIVMELVEGPSLEELAGELSREAGVEVVRQVALALSSAHAAGLLHRDVKPANILVGDRDEDLRAVLVDFGLVRDVNAPSETRQDQILGTPPYMAPEQVLGGDVDSRSDIYSLGATFYELLTGKPPFHADRLGELLVKICKEEVVPPRRLDPGIPVDLESIVLRCLEKKPDKRFAETAELAEELRRFQQGLTIQSRRPSAATRALRAIRRNRLVSVSLLAVSLAFIALFANSWISRQQVRHERDLASLGDTIERRIQRARASSTTNWPDLRAEVDARLVPIEDRLNRGRSPAAAAAHFLLGKTRMLLDQPKPAVDHLTSAWALGLRTSDVSYFLGRSLLQRFDQETWNYGFPRMQPEFQTDLETRYLEPAVEHLERIDQSDGEVFELARALIAYYRSDQNDAVAQIVRAGERFPNDLEIALFEGRLLHRLALEAWSASDKGGYRKALGSSQDAYRRVLPVLPGAVQAYLGLCRLAMVEVPIESQLKRGVDSGVMATASLPCHVARQLDPDSTVPTIIEAKLSMVSAWSLFSKDPEKAFQFVDRAQELADSLPTSDPGSLSALSLRAELLRFQALRPERFSDPLKLIARIRTVIKTGHQLLAQELTTPLVEMSLLEALLVLNQLSHEAALDFSETAAQAAELASKRLEARPAMLIRRQEMARALLSQYLAEGPPRNPDHLLRAHEVLEGGRTDEPEGHAILVEEASILIILADQFDPNGAAPERWLDPAEALYARIGDSILTEYAALGMAEIARRRARYALDTGTGAAQRLDEMRSWLRKINARGANAMSRRLLEAEMAILDLALATEAGQAASVERDHARQIFEQLMAEVGNSRLLLTALRLAAWYALTGDADDPSARAGLVRGSTRATQAIKTVERPATFLFGRGILTLITARADGSDPAPSNSIRSGCTEIQRALELEPHLLYEDPLLLRRSIELSAAGCTFEPLSR